MPSPDRHHFIPKDDPEIRAQAAGGQGQAFGPVFAVKVYDAAGSEPEFTYTVKDLNGATLGTGVGVEQARPTINSPWPWEYSSWTADWVAAGDGTYGLACYDGETLKLLAALDEHWNWVAS